MIHMSETQKRGAVALIKSSCCNHWDGNCLLLDDGEEQACPQLISHSLICKYFRDAVLPVDKLLHAQIMGTESVKGCEVCGKPFRATGSRAKYCERCAKIQRNKRQREYMQRRASAF